MFKRKDWSEPKRHTEKDARKKAHTTQKKTKKKTQSSQRAAAASNISMTDLNRVRKARACVQVVSRVEPRVEPRLETRLKPRLEPQYEAACAPSAGAPRMQKGRGR